MKQLIKALTKEATIIAILLYVQQSVFNHVVKSCSDAPLHIYLILYFSATLFCAVQNLIYTHDDVDKITHRHITWALVTILVTFLYVIVGNTLVSILVGIYLFLSKKILFWGTDEKAMTWDDVKKILKIA